MNIRELLIRIGVSTGTTGAELDKVDSKVQKVKNSFEMLNGALGILAAGASLRSIISIGDEMQNLQSRIGNATGDMAGAAAQMDVLSKHADDGRVAVDNYIGSWAKMMSGVKQFGGTADDTTKFMDTLSAAFVSNGTDTQTANAALFQLSQTMQGGQVQGEEMNSLIDAQGELYHDLAVEIGGTVTKYKKMQAAGKVTSEMLLKAVNKFYDKYQGRVEKMPMTVAQAWTKITNQWKMGIAHMNQASPVITDIANLIVMLGDKGSAALAWLVDALGGTQSAINDLKWQIGGLVAIFAGAKLISLLTNPFTYVIIAIMAAIAVVQDLTAWIRGDTKTAFGELFGSFDQFKPKLDAAAKAITDFKDNSIRELRELKEMLDSIANAFNAIIDSPNTIRRALGLSETKGFGEGGGTAGDGARESIPGQAYTQLFGWLDNQIGKAANWMNNTDTPRAIGPRTMGRDALGVPTEGGVNMQNSGNVTNHITVIAQPGQSPEDIGNAVAGKVSRPVLPGTFNPASLMNNAGAK
ncbi:tail length tape measure protein [Pantoea phage vB_PagM_LIET2]|uniref:Tape measure protein n=1 Tax=Pantoea phage vB_PagM_LIET2 TaxID=2508071 RepID=A0A411AW62_9CAUD|nr:tail length tape measure protein [Pantoea phage vB_PagM_LIET2]QAX92341.1 tape measure protein [Pantoea phage vB_PagM_LIET2]